MDILILTGIFPPAVGGPATYVPRVARGLLDRGWRVTVCTARGHDRENRFPYPVRRLHGPLPFRALEGLVKLPRLAAGRDLTYVNGLTFEYHLSRLIHRTPYVLKVVGDRTWERFRLRTGSDLSIEAFQSASSLPVRYRLERSLRRRIARAAAGIVVPSHYLKNVVRRWGVPAESISVIYNTAHPPETFPTDPPEWPGRNLRLLTAGRLVPWKRIPDLIGRVEPMDDAGLIVLGDGPDAERSRQTARRLNMEERVVFKGNVERAEVWRHLNACDLLLLHSTYEGFPHLLLEAMATGAPVLASGSGGTRELANMFPDHIELYDPDRPGQLTKKLQEGGFPGRGTVPDFPSALQWGSVLDETAEVLSRYGEGEP